MNTQAHSCFAYADAAAQAHGLALAVAALLRHHIARRGTAVLAVSGGRSPLPFFEALSQQSLPWDKVTVTLVDERWVAADDAACNGALVRGHLLQNHARAARWLPLLAEDTPADFFRQPEHITQSLEQALAAYVQPDVVVLGMGEDGHTASLFPQAPQLAAALAADAAPLVHTTPVTAPHERIGMSAAAIAAAADVLLSIGGAAKQAVLQQALAAPSTAMPVGLVLGAPSVHAHIHYHD
ncbi:6-phosphogluconolactonase [Neisseria sp. HSC-16F19]|nr:6-phosphogluconolactonase [Neisseria sp. HSC-16F19]MCP2040266.1 6-phosphogluconolactonase [Neisseria sp. HSC-16F19]